MTSTRPRSFTSTQYYTKMAQQHLTSTQVIAESGKNKFLQPVDRGAMIRLEHYAKDLPVGTLIEVHYSVKEAADKSLPQLARVHAMIREIALNSGHNQAFVKEYVKREAGLTKVDEAGQTVVRSFKDCTKTEMSLAIEVCVNFANILSIPLGDL